jgi:hypothetical protein
MKGKRKKTVENREYKDMLVRMIRAYSVRCQEGDAEDIKDFIEISNLVNEEIARSMYGLIRKGYSHNEIASVCGGTRQAVFQRIKRSGIK